MYFDFVHALHGMLRACNEFGSPILIDFYYYFKLINASCV